MKSYEESVREFHQKYGHPISEKPTSNVPYEVTELRKKLIMEELQEMLLGMADGVLIDIADGAADLIYVIVGTCIVYGIPVDRIFAEVHRSNMTKTYAKAPLGQKYGTDSPKGIGYVPPDIEGILENPEKPTTLEMLGVGF